MNKVGAIGFPIDHSLSPAMHNAAFAALGMSDWYYDKIALPPDIVKIGLKELRDHGFIGVNVTVPLKQAVMPYVKPTALAKAVGAVNTIDFRDNTGTNTDVAGFMDDLTAYGIDVMGMNVVVLGAGGAARAAVYGLARAGARIVIVNRTLDRARQLIADLQVNALALTLKEAAQKDIDLIVNCTSAGMIPHVDNCPWGDDVPFPAGATVYDMIYRPAQTALMRKAEAHGGCAVGGLGMLARQGAASFKLWTGVTPSVDIMLQAAQAALDAQQKSIS